MRMILPIAAVLALLGSAAVAQTDESSEAPCRRCFRARAWMKLVPTESPQKSLRPALAARLRKKLTVRRPA